jgi:hypothetical protein
LKELQGVPGIPRVRRPATAMRQMIDSFVYKGRVHIVMEKYDADLFAMLQAAPVARLPDALVVHIMLAVARALAGMHARGIAHQVRRGRRRRSRT